MRTYASLTAPPGRVQRKNAPFHDPVIIDRRKRRCRARLTAEPKSYESHRSDAAEQLRE